MNLDAHQIDILRKIEMEKIDPSEAYSNNLLSDMIFQKNYISYSLYSDLLTGRYQIKKLYLTQKGKVELALALEQQKEIDNSNAKIIVLLVGLIIGIITGNLIQ